ncbi:MAG: FtsH protease activity modulator HflK [Verrucomicrobia bacterium]|nr:FtsH protease activity modulator HflK [Verrucomicrobiota bacterium]MDA1046686.1 FtsH protease activity modulator HflK [Verrucomicrobiota bacterium]
MNNSFDASLPEFLRGGRILWVVAGILVIAGLGSSIYTVEPESEGVVLRFGKHLDTVPAGLHWKLPFGIDDVYVLPVKRQLKQEFGFGSEGATNDSQVSSRREQDQERSMVTGDLNTAVVEWVVQYRIVQPDKFLFKVQNPEDTLRNVSQAVMRTMVGDRTVDEVITIGRQEIEEQARIMLAEQVNNYELGIQIDLIQLLNVKPPPLVEPSFNEVNQAKQEKKRMINVAEGKKEEVRKAEGEAQQKIQAAEGYAEKRVNEAEGDVSRFNAVFDEYLKAPQVTKQRLYLETMKEVLPQLGRKIILDQELSRVLPLLQLETALDGRSSR